MKSLQGLVLITVDCLRADHVGFLGYHRPTTPFLDSLAKHSIVFSNAIVAGTPTYYALPALFASRYPLAFGRDVIGLAPDESTMASILQESGFATAAFIAGNPYISAQFGYDRGFDVFRNSLLEERRGPDLAGYGSSFRTRTNRVLSATCHSLPGLGPAYDELYFHYCQSRAAGRQESFDSLRRFPSADAIVDHAAGWLTENSNRPFLLWLHFMDPHAPYYPKSEALGLMGDGSMTATDARYLNSYWARGGLDERRLEKKCDQVIKLYDAGIRWADEQIRRLTERLVELNVWDKCALAVTADHGEEFLDHGARFHTPLKLTEELIRVPLMIRVPSHGHAEVGEPTSLIHLAPTLLDILELSSPADFRGQSCWKRTGKPGGQSPAITEAVHGCANPLISQNRMAARILSLRQKHYKLIINFSSRSEELFDLQSDPHERSPLPAAIAKPVRRQLLQHARKHLVESHQSRDFGQRNAALLRDLRLEWAHPSASAPN